MKVEATTRYEDLPQFLTVSDYHSVSRMGKSFIYKSIKSGQLQAVKFGRVIRIPKTALKSLLPLD